MYRQIRVFHVFQVCGHPVQGNYCCINTLHVLFNWAQFATVTWRLDRSPKIECVWFVEKLFTGRMTFWLPNQQCQSTRNKTVTIAVYCGIAIHMKSHLLKIGNDTITGITVVVEILQFCSAQLLHRCTRFIAKLLELVLRQGRISGRTAPRGLTHVVDF